MISRAAAALEGAAVVSGHARRTLGEIRRSGGSLSIGELSGSPHDLGPLLGELVAAGLVELVDAAGKRMAPRSVTVMLRSGGYRKQARACVARIAPGADRVAVRVPSAGA